MDDFADVEASVMVMNTRGSMPLTAACHERIPEILHASVRVRRHHAVSDMRWPSVIGAGAAGSDPSLVEIDGRRIGAC